MGKADREGRDRCCKGGANVKGEPTRGVRYDILESWGRDTDVTFPETSMQGVGRNKKFETCPT